MGKRARRRSRGENARRESAPLAQQMARVNVDHDTWIAFRLAALRRHKSIAAYLGDLVTAEVARRARAAAVEAQASSVPSSTSGVHGPAA